MLLTGHFPLCFLCRGGGGGAFAFAFGVAVVVAAVVASTAAAVAAAAAFACLLAVVAITGGGARDSNGRKIVSKSEQYVVEGETVIAWVSTSRVLEPAP